MKSGTIHKGRAAFFHSQKSYKPIDNLLLFGYNSIKLVS